VKRAARKQAESAPHGSFNLNASFPLLLQSDDEQTEHNTRCYEETSTMDDATKKHDIYETNKRAVL
jgi:hypothetical protein